MKNVSSQNNNEPRKKRGKEEHVSEDDFGDVALQEPLLDNNKNEINQINEQNNIKNENQVNEEKDKKEGENIKEEEII